MGCRQPRGRALASLAHERTARPPPTSTPADYETKTDLRVQARAAGCIDSSELSFLGAVPPGGFGPPACTATASGRAGGGWAPHSQADPENQRGRTRLEHAPSVGGESANYCACVTSGIFPDPTYPSQEALHTQSYSRQVDDHAAYPRPLAGSYALAPQDHTGWSLASHHAGPSIAEPPPVWQSQEWTAQNVAVHIDPAAPPQLSRDQGSWGPPGTQLLNGEMPDKDTVLAISTQFAGRPPRPKSGGLSSTPSQEVR